MRPSKVTKDISLIKNKDIYNILLYAIYRANNVAKAMFDVQLDSSMFKFKKWKRYEV